VGCSLYTPHKQPGAAFLKSVIRYYLYSLLCCINWLLSFFVKMYFKKIVYGGNEVCALVMLQRSWHYCSWWCLWCCCLHTCADGHSTTILIANFVSGFLLKWFSQRWLASILYLKIWDLIWHQLDLNLKYFLFLKFDSGSHCCLFWMYHISLEDCTIC
jgi:hypothetical protein